MHTEHVIEWSHGIVDVIQIWGIGIEAEVEIDGVGEIDGLVHIHV